MHDPPSSLDPDQLALQNQVPAEWGGFARYGDPTVAGTPRWSRYTAAAHPVMAVIAGGDSTIQPTAMIGAEHHCGFWGARPRRAWQLTHAEGR
ncbi:MAG TPA: hypothetical protein VFW09_02435 [Solirubrobacteraceae bacterium]|nr:hypothetical protein [Solirubrobacteraceae bacterium]